MTHEAFGGDPDRPEVPPKILALLREEFARRQRAQFEAMHHEFVCCFLDSPDICKLFDEFIAEQWDVWLYEAMFSEFPGFVEEMMAQGGACAASVFSTNPP